MIARLVVVSLLAVALTGCGFSPPDDALDACNVVDSAGVRGRRSLSKHEDTSASDRARVLAVFYTESTFRKKVKAPRHERSIGNFWCIWRFWNGFRCKRISSSRGFTQAIDATWDEFQDATKAGKRSNFDDSVRFVHWYTKRIAKVCGSAAAKSDYAFYVGYYAGIGNCRASRLEGITEANPTAHKLAVKFADRAESYRHQLRACRKA